MCMKLNEEGQSGDLEPTEEVEEGMAQGGSEEAEEVRQVRAPPIPVLPSREEVQNHRLTHTPYRSWCPHCVRGRGREDRHMRSPQKGEFEGVPKLVCDYFFLGTRRPQSQQERPEVEEEAERDGQTPVIMLKDSNSKSIFAHACPRKGADDRVAMKICADLDALGYRRVLVRTDGEPALLDLWRKVKALVG